MEVAVVMEGVVVDGHGHGRRDGGCGRHDGSGRGGGCRLENNRD